VSQAEKKKSGGRSDWSGFFHRCKALRCACLGTDPRSRCPQGTFVLCAQAAARHDRHADEHHVNAALRLRAATQKLGRHRERMKVNVYCVLYSDGTQPDRTDERARRKNEDGLAMRMTWVLSEADVVFPLTLSHVVETNVAL
jgi:hypothetical protein